MGTVVGTAAAAALVPLGLGSDGWKIASALAARHIGGAVNYVAVSVFFATCRHGRYLVCTHDSWGWIRRGNPREVWFAVASFFGESRDVFFRSIPPNVLLLTVLNVTHF